MGTPGETHTYTHLTPAQADQGRTRRGSKPGVNFTKPAVHMSGYIRGVCPTSVLNLRGGFGGQSVLHYGCWARVCFIMAVELLCWPPNVKHSLELF